MIGFRAVLEAVALDEDELRGWIESGWLRPERHEGDWRFEEIDLARARLIRELRHELEIADAELPTVLLLLDQIYALRGALGRLCRAVEAQPEATRRAIVAAVRDGIP